MFIVSFAFGFIALAFAVHFTDKKWVWITSGIGTFILSAIAVEFEIVIIPILFLSLILLIELYLLIERFLKKH